MMRRRSIGILSAGLLCATASTLSAAERMVGVVPSDGIAMLVKRFPVASGTTVLGVEFRNNDPATAFPEVVLVRGGTTALAEGTVLARANDVREVAGGTVQALWSEPVVAPEGGDFYVGVRLPVGPGKQGIGNGPALGATDVSEPSGSFIAGGVTGDLMPVLVDLQMSLLTPRVSKAGPPQSDETALARAFLRVGSPNPAPSTRIEFGLERALPVRLAIYDVGGRQVRLLHDGSLDIGTHSRTWDGRDDGGVSVAAGVYIVRLHTGERVLTQKIVLTR